jgi:hypothetical protein
MELEEALHVWAADQTELAALLAEPNRFRLYKLKLEPNTKQPATVQQRTGAGRQVRSCTVDGAVRVSLQLDHYGRTVQQMTDVAKAWRLVLSPDNLTYPVQMGGGPGVGVKVKSATLENEFDFDDPEPGLLRRVQLWTFWIFEV